MAWARDIRRKLDAAEPYSAEELGLAEQLGLRQYRATLVVTWTTCVLWAAVALAAGAYVCAPVPALLFGLPMTRGVRRDRRRWVEAHSAGRAKLETFAPEDQPEAEAELEAAFRQARKIVIVSLVIVWLGTPVSVWSYGFSAVTVTLGAGLVVFATAMARRRLREMPAQMEERREKLQSLAAVRSAA